MTTPRLVLCELAPARLPRHESYSPFCLKAHRALGLAHLSYERRHAARPGSFRALNPAAQVPVLLVDGDPVADSTAIVTRIEALARPLGGSLSARDRAEAFLWEELADTVLNGFLVAARWLDDENWPRTKAAYFSDMPGLVRAIVPDRLRAKVRRALFARDVVRPDLAGTWARFEETLDRLEARAPKQGFFVSEEPSRADVAIFAQLFSLKTPLTPAQWDRVALRPALAAYLERVDAACEAARGAASGTFAAVRPIERAAAFG